MKAIHMTGSAPYYTNCFLLITDAGHGIVVDASAPPEQVEQALAENHATLTHIFLTHGHHDHVETLPALRARWPEAKLYMCAEDAQGNTGFPAGSPDVNFEDEMTIQVDELSFQVWRTPGHTKGSCCLLCGNYFFTGDTLFAQEIGRTDLPGGSMDEMWASLRKLYALPVPDEAQVLPGHEEFSTFGYEKAHNPYLKRCMNP